MGLANAQVGLCMSFPQTATLCLQYRAFGQNTAGQTFLKCNHNPGGYNTNKVGVISQDYKAPSVQGMQTTLNVK